MRLNTGSRSTWLLLFLLTTPLAREASGQTLVLVREYIYLGDGKMIAAQHDLTTGASATPGSLGLPTEGSQVVASDTPVGVPRRAALARSTQLGQNGSPWLPLFGQEASWTLLPAVNLFEMAGLYTRPFQYPHAESNLSSRLLADNSATLPQPEGDNSHDK